jgi:hypothetical protein
VFNAASIIVSLPVLTPLSVSRLLERLVLDYIVESKEQLDRCGMPDITGAVL